LTDASRVDERQPARCLSRCPGAAPQR